jgi:hypothetical protein
MIGFASLTAVTTARTAPTRDTPHDAGAGGPPISRRNAASIAGIKLRSIVPVLALLLTGCGGGSRPSATGVPRVERAVKSVLEQRLMTSQPRTEQGSRSSTHIRRVRCTKVNGNEFNCEVTLGDGSTRQVRARERSDGGVVLG